MPSPAPSPPALDAMDGKAFRAEGRGSVRMNASKLDFSHLQELARKGAWRSILDLVKGARKFGALYSQAERIGHATYHILTLIKLGNIDGAAEELNQLGDLDSPLLRYEEYPDVYPGMCGSMVPFGLRFVQALLPHRQGQTSSSLRRMYRLLSHCQQKQQGDDEEDDFRKSTWQRRHDTVLCTLINLHLHQKDYVPALGLLDQMLAKRPGDPLLWSRFAYIQLQLGDVENAKLTFNKVQALIQQQLQQEDGALACLVSRNEGLQSFVERDYSAAVKAFNGVLEQAEGDPAAANNKALSLMYSRDLIRATQVLEDVVHKHTATALSETLVLNLCSMYELAAVSSAESKRSLGSWIMKVAPDDFDLSCTRL